MSALPARWPGLAAVALCLAAIISPPAIAARHHPSAVAAEVQRCILRTAGGRTWLARTLWALSDQEGGWVGAKVPNDDGSYDLGPMQINSAWVPRLSAATGRTRADVAQWLQYDACFNIDAARWIFLSALAATRDYWKAIGTYHSRTAWRRQRYAVAVAARLRRRFGPAAFGSDHSR